MLQPLPKCAFTIKLDSTDILQLVHVVLMDAQP